MRIWCRCQRFVLIFEPHLLDELVALLVVEDVGEALYDGGGGGGAAEGGEQRRMRGRRLRHGAQHPHGREGVRGQPPRVPARGRQEWPLN